MMRPAFTAPICILLFAAAASAPTEPILKVSTHSGRLPLELTLTGELVGVELAQVKDCLVNVEWNYTTPAGLKMNAKTDLPCVDEVSAPRVPQKFEKLVMIKEPGTYLYRLVLVPQDGRRMAFTTHEVKAYRGPLEVNLVAKPPF